MSRGASLPNRPSRFSHGNSLPKGRTNPNHERQVIYKEEGKPPQQKSKEVEVDPAALSDTPILCNRYVVGKKDALSNHVPGNKCNSSIKN